VLLDTGQSGTVLLHNLDTLQLDAGTLAALALSHAHYDHTGGLPALAERLAPGLPLYANADLLRERFSQSTGERRAIGLSVDHAWLAARFALHLDDAPQQVLPGVWTTGAITERPYPGGYVPRQEIRASAGYAPDPYRDDLSLVVEGSAGLIVLCGCCHAGLLNNAGACAAGFSTAHRGCGRRYPSDQRGCCHAGDRRPDAGGMGDPAATLPQSLLGR